MKAIFITLFLLCLATLFLVMQPTFTQQNTENITIKTNVNNLKKFVYEIVESFPNRVYTNTKTLDGTAAYIYEHFATYSKEVNYETFKVKDPFHDKTREYKNIIATFKGTQGVKDEYIIVGGHYDTFAGYTGANDNTSSVAGLLELARLFSLHPPKSNVMLVSYCLEEPPFFATDKMGSFKYAQNLKLNNKKVRVSVIMDMIGFYSEEKNSQNYPAPFMNVFYPKEANFISIVSTLGLKNIFYTRKAKNSFKKSSNLSVYSINAPTLVEGIDFSDQRNYWKFGYPAVMVSDTAFYRTDNYHTMNDTPETLNYENMAKVVEGIFEMVRGL